MVYSVFITETFEKIISKLSEKERRIIQKIFLQLKENPYVGDPIRYKFFREKRLKEKRIYYLIYENLSAVLVVVLGNKKEQQETIDNIINYLPRFKEYIEQLLKG